MSDSEPRLPTVRGLVVIGVVAIMLGLPMVSTSLFSRARLEGVLRRSSALSMRGHQMASTGQSLAMPVALAEQSAVPALPTMSATVPWKSPLYPQNGGTLWDRIRVSTKRDRRAFLLGTAIQIHAPATAATPVPRFSPLP
jgi:hypothetical protein